MKVRSSRIGYKAARFESELNNVRNFISNFESNKESFKDVKLSRINYESGDLNTVKGNLNLPVDIGLISTDFGNITDNGTGNFLLITGLIFRFPKAQKYMHCRWYSKYDR